jgi:hypothetical protein
MYLPLHGSRFLSVAKQAEVKYVNSQQERCMLENWVSAISYGECHLDQIVQYSEVSYFLS